MSDSKKQESMRKNTEHPIQKQTNKQANKRRSEGQNTKGPFQKHGNKKKHLTTILQLKHRQTYQVVLILHKLVLQHD